MAHVFPVPATPTERLTLAFRLPPTIHRRARVVNVPVLVRKIDCELEGRWFGEAVARTLFADAYDEAREFLARTFPLDGSPKAVKVVGRFPA